MLEQYFDLRPRIPYYGKSFVLMSIKSRFIIIINTSSKNLST